MPSVLYECTLPDGTRVERRCEGRVTHALAVVASRPGAPWFAWRWTCTPELDYTRAREYFASDVRIVTLPATPVPPKTKGSV